MDEAREHLHRHAETSPGPIAGLLNWLSNSAFGFGKEGGMRVSYREWLLQQWRLPAEVKYQKLVAEMEMRRRQAAAEAAARPEVVSSLSSLLFISEQRVQELAERHPQLLSIPPADVAQRMLAWKQLLPWSDVAAMVEAHPALLGVEASYTQTVVRRRLQMLKEGMPGADLFTMVQDHPWVLLEDVEAALPHLDDLWPVPEREPDMFAVSSPAHLALALKAMAWQGPLQRGDEPSSD